MSDNDYYDDYDDDKPSDSPKGNDKDDKDDKDNDSSKDNGESDNITLDSPRNDNEDSSIDSIPADDDGIVPISLEDKDFPIDNDDKPNDNAKEIDGDNKERILLSNLPTRYALLINGTTGERCLIKTAKVNTDSK